MVAPETDAITELIEKSEANLISTTPGAVPPHLDDGGHLPFGGTIGGTSGPSAFGKRKMTRANAIGNPQALLLNYPPECNEVTLKCWDRNYKSSIYMDPAAEAGRYDTSNFGVYGPSPHESHLSTANRTWGNLRRTACTRPTPAPTFHPPPRECTAEQVAAADYCWTWPDRPKRAEPPQIQRPAKVTQTFLEEYELRPPWMKY